MTATFLQAHTAESSSSSAAGPGPGSGLEVVASSLTDSVKRAPGSSRKGSRAFKLGEFQLKQLRNGDVYKVCRGGGGGVGG